MPLPNEARAPILHYDQTADAFWSTLAYIERAFDEGNRYPAVVERHLARLYSMVLVNLIENFERFLKEAAAECIEQLADYTTDDRFSAFHLQGSGLAAHFAAGTRGKALCESATWLDCEDINKRFRKLLADPFKDGKFTLFPQQPPAERSRTETMSLVWQLHHTVVHNVGVITTSDAVKLRLLAREPVNSPRLLTPTRDDVRFLKRFLDEMAQSCNQLIGERLAELFTTLHTETPMLFEPQQIADRLAASFRIPAVVATATGIVPHD